MEAGADVTVTMPVVGLTALHIAADLGQLRIVTSLLSGASNTANVIDPDGNTPLDMAVKEGHQEVVETLVSHTNKAEGQSMEEVMAPGEGEFIPSETFDGSRPGYVFKAGSRGNGYYRDTPPVPTVGAWSEDGAEPAAGPSDPEVDAKVEAEAEAAKVRGNNAFKAKNLEVAIACYTEAIELRENHVYYNNRSMCLLKLGRKEEAVADAQKARKLDPKDLKACWRLGAALEALERFDEAGEAYFDGQKMDMDGKVGKELGAAFKKCVERGKQHHAFHNYNEKK